MKKNQPKAGARIDAKSWPGGWARIGGNGLRAHLMERMENGVFRAECDSTLTPALRDALGIVIFEPGEYQRCAACARIGALMARGPMIGPGGAA